MSFVRYAQIWAILGFITILGYAVYRLFGHFLLSWEYEYQWYHWLILVGNTAFMAYSEGYKGFQQSYSIKFSNRLRQIESNPSIAIGLLAPLYCMSYFAADRRNILSAYILTFAIVLLIIFFSYIPQPWRGILDVGVVVGLSWGIIATFVLCLNVFKKS
ncbi:hypothetical protein [Kangiella sp. HZ709]|uniref:hypothetical protein n=1 Tax=Kangiella sp. HZ709 TaxID=2666328 RepID=UPI0012B13638|nr:hypothetical protein [Kangiella sp. HZ709]MRX27595.1 hypothetical protein [Kangiella sp. HZ709]